MQSRSIGNGIVAWAHASLGSSPVAPPCTGLSRRWSSVSVPRLLSLLFFPFGFSLCDYHCIVLLVLASLLLHHHFPQPLGSGPTVIHFVEEHEVSFIQHNIAVLLMKGLLQRLYQATYYIPSHSEFFALSSWGAIPPLLTATQCGSWLIGSGNWSTNISFDMPWNRLFLEPLTVFPWLLEYGRYAT